ncbi:DUF3131 domain-containing protein [Pseudorhodobacter ferrugineus]|uniref:DUF3131 domain-containing protein n=1 Tax=Pseudorhodobacter ferrugineus TaxID=77008 RepID=UPI0003B46E8A|nr:DUF3131 domain-containing protein [Pseudorhodobacter ferrugineus]
MKRRSFLKIGAALGVSASRLQAASLSPKNIPPRIIVLTDITSETDLDGLATAMTVLAKRNIPFACAIDPSANHTTALMPDSPVAQLLQRFFLGNPGIMELAPLIPDLEQHRPYFQARLASLAIAQLCETLGLDVVDALPRSISTVSCHSTPNPQLLTGLRAAGVRTVLALPRDDRQATSNRQSENGILHLIGGQKLNFAETDITRFSQSVTQNTGIFSVSAQNFGSLKAASAIQSLDAETTVLRQMDITGQGGPVLPRDIMIRDGNSFARHIALHILDATGPDLAFQTGVELMKSLLAQHNIGFSVSAPPLPKRVTLDGLAFWMPLVPSTGKALGRKVQLEPPVWASFSTLRNTPFPDPLRQSPGQEIILRTEQSAWQGMDAKGRYHQPLAFEVTDTAAIAALPNALNPLSDSLVVLHSLALTSPANRMAILRALNGFRDDAVTEIVDLKCLIDLSVPPDTLLPLYRQTEAGAPAVLRHTHAPDTDHDALMQDARAAWGYFEKLTNKNTGLCTASNDFSASTGSRYDRVTMWDIGSHLNALIAGVDLGLLSQDSFQNQTKRILKRISGRNIKGLNLPPEEINVATGSTTRNFNASDTCRLLASLANLANHPAIDAGLVQKVVNGWAIKDVILDGRLHAISGKNLVAADFSQYAHYSAMGLKRWGFDAKSPYAGFTDITSTDQKIQFLERLQLLGPVGTEPLLLDALDNGFSPSVTYLSEVLFTAMASEYRTSGRILCPSETPLNRSPWFVYQGYQVGEGAAPWKVSIVEKDKITATAVADSFMAISCKSAYLWAMIFDHPFAELLLRTVREKARDKVGFASCIFVDTGIASTDYTDINTNGIILQSIAYRLGAGRARK